MASAPEPFVFRQIPSTEAKRAFNFHLSLADNKYIWPRTEDQIGKYASEGELFAIQMVASLEIVGICYVTLDDERNRWELGGLSVAKTTQDLGLGTVLGRFALSRTIAEKSPWASNQEIIAHVHEENKEPRNLLNRIGFRQQGQESISGDEAPAAMKRNDNGNVVGDVFVFPRGNVGQLASEFQRDIGGPLRDGKTLPRFDFGAFGAQNVLAALDEAAG